MGNITNLKENKTVFIPCSCKREILVIEYDHAIDMADFAIYEKYTSSKHKLSLWQRVLYSYHIMTGKRLYPDQIKLDKSQLQDLQKFLNTIL